jgi:cytochrome c oxidase assembly protein subunit 15
MLLGLAIKALLIALVPLTAVWLARGGDRYRKLAWVTAFLTFDLIVFGGFTRLTDSGLGCPDWPGCYGEANPFLAHADISAAQAALPTGPVTVFKAWIEMIHRYLAMGVGVLIIALLAIGWRLWRRTREQRYAPALPALLLLWVCVQGAFGAWTVTLKLQPVIVTIHLLLGMGLLALLVWHAMRQSPSHVVGDGAASLRVAAAAALIVLFMQIGLGGWVSTNYAVLACGGFPLCQGELMPAMDFRHGFTLWRELGMTGSGDYLPFDALVAVNWVHRMFAFVVVAFLVYVGWRAARVAGTERLGRGLMLVILIQFGTGIATVALDWPLTIAVLHNAGAALSVALLTMLNCALARQQTGSGEPVRATLHPA